MCETSGHTVKSRGGTTKKFFTGAKRQKMEPVSFKLLPTPLDWKLQNRTTRRTGFAGKLSIDICHPRPWRTRRRTDGRAFDRYIDAHRIYAAANEKIFCRKSGNRPTFWWKLRESPFAHFGGSVANSMHKFYFRALLSLYYRSPDGATAERTQRCYRVSQ